MEKISAYRRFSHEPSEEKFVLASGLNDILIAIGIGLLSLGTFIHVLLLIPDSYQKNSLSGTFWASLFWGLMGLVLSWGLSEYLTRYRKLVLPSMVLVMSVAVFSYVFAAIVLSLWSGDKVIERIFLITAKESDKAKIMTIMLSPIGALLAYYWRFGLPFTLFMIGATATLAALRFYELLFKDFLRVDILFLIAGFFIFLWAMRFDVKDPERQTRFSDCAFWLHLLAAPLFVGSLTHMLVPDFSAMNASKAVIVALVIFVLGFVSIVIDRRSLFMAGLVALGTSIAYGIKMFMKNPELDSASLFSITMLILGGFVLFLGVGWVSVRRLLIKYCIPPRVAARLRPVEEKNYALHLS